MVKRVVAVICIIMIVAVFMTGCMGDVVDVTVVLKNATPYELKWIIFNIPQSSGTYSPMHNVITGDDESLKPDELREVTISFVDSDFGNSGGALIGLEDAERSASSNDVTGKVSLISNKKNCFIITFDGESFAIESVDTLPSSPVLESSAAISPVPTPSVEDDAAAFVDPYIDEAIALIESDRRDDLPDVTFGYEPTPLYDSLSAEEKTMYDEMLGKAQTLTPFSYTVAEHGYETLDMAMVVYGALSIDYPELENFFMLSEVTVGDMTTALEYRYFMPWDSEQNPADTTSLREEILLFSAVCERIIERMPDDFSAYDKYRYLASVISLITSYDYDDAGGWQVGSAYGSIIGGYSICQGYSRGFMYLCKKADLWCETVDGVAGDNEAHMWNIVKLDSGTYFMDITWSDEQGLPGSPEWDSYFMLTQDEILVDHEITDGKVATGTPIN